MVNAVFQFVQVAPGRAPADGAAAPQDLGEGGLGRALRGTTTSVRSARAEVPAVRLRRRRPLGYPPVMLFPIVALVLAACTDGKPPAPPGALDEDGDGFSAEVDCDDGAPAVHPDATEICNERDDDCDGLTDDADDSLDLATAATWYLDADQDSYGDMGTPTSACVVPDGFSEDDADCDDGDASVHPAADEVCDDLDNDCDGLTDDADDSLDVEGARTWFADADGDTYGDAVAPVLACVAPEGASEEGSDCDDQDPAIHPDAREVCNSVDDDCDGLADDEDGSADLLTGTWYWTDADADGVGGDEGVWACLLPPSHAVEGGDCDDLDAAVHPGATEVCAPGDEDCDGFLGDADPDLDSTSATAWYADADGDGWGDGASWTTACDAPAGGVPVAGDCDDADAGTSPVGTEVCGGGDEDCDGLTDDADPGVDPSTQSTWYLDTDGDGYGDSTTALSCVAPSGYAAAGGDCDESVDSIYPGAEEVCDDGVDQDCSGDDRACPTFGGELHPEDLAVTVLYSDESSGSYAYSFTLLDWNGDGQQDLAASDFLSDVGVREGGATWVTLGPLPSGGLVMDAGATVTLMGLRANGYSGGTLHTLNDLDGDGDDELFVTAANGDDEGLVLGNSVTGSAEVSTVVIHGERCYPASLGDTDGDGVNEYSCPTESLELQVYEGIDTAPYATIEATSTGSAVGASAGPADFDGDGLTDLLFGASGETAGYSHAGSAWVFLAPIASTTIADADLTIAGTSTYQEVGEKVAVGDLDGDGQADVLVGSGLDDGGATNGGAWYGLFGPRTGSLTTASADFLVYGDETGLMLGWFKLAPFDLDGDGSDDLSFSSSEAAGDGTDRGEAWYFYGPFAGTLDLADADSEGAHLLGSDDSAHLGVTSLFADDLTGDGSADFLIGAHGAGWSGSTAGVLYVLEAE